MTASLLAAYRRTSYTVEDEGRVAAVQVDRPSCAVDAVLRRHGAGSGAFITAWNPGSRQCPLAVNLAAARTLERGLEAAGIAWLPHAGIAADGGWVEHGVLALDIAEDRALAIARRHGQNAIVVVRTGEPARLVPTVLMPDPA